MSRPTFNDVCGFGMQKQALVDPYSLRWLRDDPPPRSACSYCGLGFYKATRCSGCGAPLAPANLGPWTHKQRQEALGEMFR